ncbi:MAG: diaminopimelate epimerase [Candidatus Krumholzibacteriia bacterium]|jgi:diaminopimelate epimerase
MSAIPFVKMHGAGNDFVFIDQHDLPDHAILNREQVAAICDRRLGIGSDGLIIIGPGREGVSDFRMNYYNADGGEADMCGNGARCSVSFAHAKKMISGRCVFDTKVGLLTGLVHASDDITVSLTGWQDLNLDVDVSGSPWQQHCTCDTGVPHLIMPVPDIEDVDLNRWGSEFRHHPQFAPAGVNVNWVQLDSKTGEVLLRTYERGVEGETLACGTGASAVAVVLCQLEQVQSPVKVRTRGGDLLTIAVDLKKEELWLRGPAVTSFHGTISQEQIR